MKYQVYHNSMRELVIIPYDNLKYVKQFYLYLSIKYK